MCDTKITQDKDAWCTKIIEKKNSPWCKDHTRQRYVIQKITEDKNVRYREITQDKDVWYKDHTRQQKCLIQRDHTRQRCMRNITEHRRPVDRSKEKWIVEDDLCRREMQRERERERERELCLDTVPLSFLWRRGACDRQCVWRWSDAHTSESKWPLHGAVPPTRRSPCKDRAAAPHRRNRRWMRRSSSFAWTPPSLSACCSCASTTSVSRV